MGFHIQAILFDMGGTLRRSTRQDEVVRDQNIRKILDLLGSNHSPAEFFQILSERGFAYHNWASESFIELSESELWTRWMLPEWPSELVSRNAVRLNRLWRQSTRRRDPIPESKEVIEELFRRGYRLGLVSNTTSSTEIPELLKNLKITGLFETIILSCQVGKRKGNPAILLEATTRMNIQPEHCAYIGDQPHRDVAAARKAGFSKAVILRDPIFPERSLPPDDSLSPDHYIDNLKELFDIFPPLPAPEEINNAHESPVWNASLSTMWAMRNFERMEDFFETARRFGFGYLELNHQVSSTMLEGIDLQRYRFSSVHEPCPADISVEELKAREWLVSALDEDNRRNGVEAVKRSIDLAHTLGVRVIVVHAGHVSSDLTLEKKLRHMYDSGLSQTVEYLDIKNQMINERAALARPRLDAVHKSIQELLAYAQPLGIRLGLENRYHYPDIPTPDELESLLGLADPEQLGFWYDIGHAQALDRLGLFPSQEWLDRFASRIIGVHFHDVVGIEDHGAPGSGEVDFDQVNRHLPAGAIRTLELKPNITPEQVRNSLQFLTERRCVSRL